MGVAEAGRVGRNDDDNFNWHDNNYNYMPAGAGHYHPPSSSLIHSTDSLE